LGFKLIQEEFLELKEAKENKDFIEMGDAIADMLVVVYGYANVLGMDANKLFKLVHESNMSKLCKTEQEAIDTVEWYTHEKINHKYIPGYRMTKDGQKWLVYDTITKKVLKNKYYQAVDLSYLIKK